jgi:hypothetical protein
VGWLEPGAEARVLSLGPFESLFYEILWRSPGRVESRDPKDCKDSKDNKETTKMLLREKLSCP